MKEIKLGNGLRLTESDDMGIFIHYESISGNETGMFMGNTDDTPGHKWAVELLGMSDHLAVINKELYCAVNHDEDRQEHIGIVKYYIDKFKPNNTTTKEEIDKWVMELLKYMTGAQQWDTGGAWVCEVHPSIPYNMGYSFDCTCGGPGMPPVTPS